MHLFGNSQSYLFVDLVYNAAYDTPISDREGPFCCLEKITNASLYGRYDRIDEIES